MKAKRIIVSEVSIRRSQFFHSRRHFSSQEMLRSTTQRFGMTAKVWSSLRLATSVCASHAYPRGSGFSYFTGQPFRSGSFPRDRKVGSVGLGKKRSIGPAHPLGNYEIIAFT